MDPSNEIISRRVFAHSVSDVFSAWANPELLKIWWGPHGFTNTFHVFDFQVGGRWKFTMHGPEKGNYENEVEFIEINEPNLIKWTRCTQPWFDVAAHFEAQDENKMLLTFRMIFKTDLECEKLKPYVVDKNEENFDRLQELLSHS